MEAILSNNVLVLNRLWQAVNICSVKRAFMLLYQGHAQVVEAESGTFQTMTFDQWYSFSHGYEGADVVSTVSFKIRVPKVILLLFFDRMPKKEVKFTRHNIFERDHNQCQYCGEKFDRKDLNLDHVIPRDRGGETSWENIVCSCVPCNSRKGNRTPQEARLRRRQHSQCDAALHTQRLDAFDHLADRFQVLVLGTAPGGAQAETG